MGGGATGCRSPLPPPAPPPPPLIPSMGSAPCDMHPRAQCASARPPNGTRLCANRKVRCVRAVHTHPDRRFPLATDVDIAAFGAVAVEPQPIVPAQTRVMLAHQCRRRCGRGDARPQHEQQTRRGGGSPRAMLHCGTPPHAARGHRGRRARPWASARCRGGDAAGARAQGGTMQAQNHAHARASTTSVRCSSAPRPRGRGFPPPSGKSSCVDVGLEYVAYVGYGGMD